MDIIYSCKIALEINNRPGYYSREVSTNGMGIGSGRVGEAVVIPIILII